MPIPAASAVYSGMPKLTRTWLCAPRLCRNRAKRIALESFGQTGVRPTLDTASVIAASGLIPPSAASTAPDPRPDRELSYGAVLQPCLTARPASSIECRVTSIRLPSRFSRGQTPTPEPWDSGIARAPGTQQGPQLAQAGGETSVWFDDD